MDLLCINHAKTQKVASVLAARLGAFHFTQLMESSLGKVLACEDRSKHKVYVFKLY